MFNNQIIAGSSGQGGGSLYPYSIDQSLRFNNDDSAYLTRSIVSDGNKKTWTWSAWVKRGNLERGFLFSDSKASANTELEFLNTNGILYAQVYDGSGSKYKYTDIVFRDVAAWYHIVWSVDTTQATASDRNRVYINGEQITDWDVELHPNLNSDTTINVTGINHNIGAYQSGSNSFDGYMAEVNFIDGTALDPTSFGETINGVWVPKAYDTADGAYGTNGFYLSFADSSAIGDDLSGNTNDFTATNLAASDVVLGSPTNNFATWNVLQPAGAASGVMTLSEGNMKATGGSSIYRQVMGNMSVLSGKWYTELYITDAGYPSWTFGWTKATRYEAYTGAGNQSTHHASIGYFTGSNLYITDFGSASVATRTLSYSSNGSPTTGSIIGCAADFDNGKLWWSVNGTWVDIGSGAGDPANDTNPASTFTVSTYADDFKTPHFLNYNGSAVLNTGQDSTFAGNTTAGGNSDENGVGDFKYSVPSGFLALASSSLPEPAIGPNSAEQADDYFNTVLYTGTGATQSITGVGFQPDWTWVKRRAGVQEPSVTDSVRGVNAQLRPASTATESAQTDALTSFDADGFTLGADATNRSYNYYTDAHVAWNWKAGGTAVSNTDGSITSSVSAAPDAGFSIVGFTSTGNTETVGHGLSQAPELYIRKSRTNAENWVNFFTVVDGTLDFMNLNTTNAASGSGASLPTSTVFSIGSGETNGETHVCYCFHSVPGYQAVGKYVGNGSTDGTFVYTGFRPAWVMTKMSTNGSQWTIIDNTRNTYNAVDKGLVANTSAAEVTGSSSATPFVDFVSNGFKIRSSQAQMNQSGDTFIYLAFAEQPFKYANAR